jgi:hypothetical protein
MNKFATLLLSFIVFISYASKGLSFIDKHVLDYKMDLKNRIMVNELNQAYYSSNKHCSVEYVKPVKPVKPELRNGLNYTDHSNTTNMTLNTCSIKYLKDTNYTKDKKNPKHIIKFSRSI